MSIRVIEPRELAAHREELCDWLKANGLEPRDITSAKPIIIEQHDAGLYDVWYYAFVLTADGAKQVDPHEPDQAWTKLRSAWVQDAPQNFEVNT